MRAKYSFMFDNANVITVDVVEQAEDERIYAAISGEDERLTLTGKDQVCFLNLKEAKFIKREIIHEELQATEFTPDETGL